MTDQISRTKKRTARRRFIKGLVGGTAALALGGTTRLVGAQSRPPIKIGCLNVFTKSYAGYGETTLNGMNLYFEQVGWQSGGRKIEIIKEDDEMTPQVGLEKVRKFVESDRVHMIAGPLASNVAMAMVDYMKRSECFWLVVGAAATALTWNRMPNMFRTTFSFWQVASPMGIWVYDNVAKEIVLTGSDFVSGHDSLGSFKQSFTARGGKIIKEFYPPLGTTDFSAYLAEIRSINPPATYNFYGGTDSIRFVRQYTQYGLKEKIQLIGFNSLLDNDTLPGQGKTAVGGLTSSIYCDTLNNKENHDFVAAYRKRYKDYPNAFAEAGYTTALIIDEAAKAVGGNVEDKAKFAAAVAAVKINAPRGPMRFDPITHNPIQAIYIRKVVEGDGRIANQPIATIPEVRDPGVKPA